MIVSPDPSDADTPAGSGWAIGGNDTLTRIQRAKVAWLCVRLQLAYVGITRSLVGGDLVSSLLVPAILDVNVGHLDADPDISRRHQALDAAYPDEHRRPANALSIAHFLDIPRETARARLNSLVADGILRRTQAGYILPASTLVSDSFLPTIPRYLEALDQFISGLGLIRAFGLRPGSRLAHPVWPVAWAAMRLSTAHVLRDTAFMRALAPGMSLTACYILMSVNHAVGGQLRVLPQMPAGGGALAALAPTVGPVRGAAVASCVGLPEETVRRNLKQLVEAGHLCRVDGGFDLAQRADTGPVWRTFQKRAQANARQLIWRLTTTGVVPTTD